MNVMEIPEFLPEITFEPKLAPWMMPLRPTEFERTFTMTYEQEREYDRMRKAKYYIKNREAIRARVNAKRKAARAARKAKGKSK